MKQYTKEELDAMTWKEYTKAYREMHPENALRWRINSAIKLLKDNGYAVVKYGDSEKNEAIKGKGEKD